MDVFPRLMNHHWPWWTTTLPQCCRRYKTQVFTYTADAVAEEVPLPWTRHKPNKQRYKLWCKEDTYFGITDRLSQIWNLYQWFLYQLNMSIIRYHYQLRFSCLLFFFLWCSRPSMPTCEIARATLQLKLLLGAAKSAAHVDQTIDPAVVNTIFVAVGYILWSSCHVINPPTNK